MAYDSLSRATRTTRASLLTVCAISLSVQLFDLEDKEFQVLSVPIPDNFLVVALAIGVILLSITFFLYTYDDVKGRNTIEKDRAELKKVGEQLDEKVEEIDALDIQISNVLSRYKSNVEQGAYLNARDTGELEYLKYSVSIRLQEQLQLRAKENSLAVAVEFPRSSFLSGFRFWAVDVGIPVLGIVFVVLGWLDRLSWLKLVVQAQGTGAL